MSCSLDWRSCVNACALPSSATGTALPRRCECISMLPAISICAAPLVAWRLSRYTEASSATSDTTTPTVSVRCCDANGMRDSQPDSCSTGVRPRPPLSAPALPLANTDRRGAAASAAAPAAAVRRPRLIFLIPIATLCPFVF
ncbi:hypothetical protein D3C87_1720530 [compost metagenome]